MISIIISSVNKNQLRLVAENIRKTIGVPFELLSFDNHEGKYGICEIYNKGIAKAKYDILCFMHEDIEIHTDKWGNIVSAYFENNKELGLVGVAGSDNKSSVAGGCDTRFGTTYINIIQHFKFTDRSPKRFSLPPDRKKEVNPVVCVDGVWFCCPTDVAKEFLFDEGLKGFHGYDIDFSLSVTKKYQAVVSHEILMSHYSEGHFSHDWLDAMIYIHEKRKKELPVFLLYPGKTEATAEKQTFRYLLKKYKQNLNISFTKGVRILNASNIASYGPILYMKMYLSLVKIIFFNNSKNDNQQSSFNDDAG